MRTIKWLLNLANVKPIIFCIAILLIAVSTLTAVIIERNNRLNSCDKEKIEMRQYYEGKLNDVYIQENKLQEEMKQILNSIIASYKAELEEQKLLNIEMQKAIKENKVLINKNKQ